MVPANSTVSWLTTAICDRSVAPIAATRTADAIILMEKGTVAAQGTHGELLAGSVLYRSLWNDYLRGTGAGNRILGACASRRNGLADAMRISSIVQSLPNP